MNKRAFRTSTCALFGVSAVCAASSAYAQNAADGGAAALEEIIVTAERRDVSLQDTGVSVTAISGDELETQGRFSVEQILKDVPGVTVTDQGFAGYVVTLPSDNPAVNVMIRGVPAGQQPIVGSGASSSAYYVDGIYSGVGGDFDIERVEVLRGPQGTLYGRSATSGLMAVHTRDPRLAEFDANALLEAGSESLFRAQGAVNIPMGESFALRLAATHYEEDGYVSAEGAHVKQNQARIKLLWEPSDQVSLKLGALTREDDTNTGGFGTRLLPDRTTIFNEPLDIFTATTKQKQLWAELTVDVGIGDLIYAPSFRDYDTEGDMVGPFADTTQNQEINKDEFMTHELRLISSPDSAVSWQAGAIHYKNEVVTHQFPEVLVAPSAHPFVNTGVWFDLVNDRKITDKGVFAEATFPFTDYTRLTTGLRYNETELEIHGVGQVFLDVIAGLPPEFNPPPVPMDEVLKYTSTTYKARLEHDLTDQNMIYGMVSTGVLPGDAQLELSAPSFRENIYQEEELTSYEIGSKNRFLNETLQINGSFFFYDYGGIQQSVALAANVGGNNRTVTVPAEMYGFEADVSWRLTNNDLLGLVLGYTHAKYLDKPADIVDLIAQEDIPEVIPFMANLSYTHTFHLPGGSTLDFLNQVRYTDDYLSESLRRDQIDAGDYPYYVVDARTIFDTNLSWTSANGRYGVSAYVNNVFDKEYITRVTGAQTAQYFADLTPLRPRSYGASFRFNY